MNRYLLTCFFVVFCALQWTSTLLDASWAGNPESAVTKGQMEATVIHVDKYGVYVPNLIFYWDSKVTKQNLDAMMKAAEKLRNKPALITYSAVGDLAKDKKPLLVDIAAHDELTKQMTTGLPTDDPLQAAAQYRPNSADAREEQDDREDEDDDQQFVTYSSAHRRPYPENESSEREEPARPITREEVQRFVNKCIKASCRKDMETALSCYADKVDYYSTGIVDRSHIRRDKGYYFSNWERIDSSIDGDIVLIVTDQQNVRIAKFESLFWVENRNRGIRGRAENVWKLQRIGDELRIVGEKQRILTRR